MREVGFEEIIDHGSKNWETFALAWLWNMLLSSDILVIDWSFIAFYWFLLNGDFSLETG